MRIIIDHVLDNPSLLDGSELLRPEDSPHGGPLDKPVAKFRDYTVDLNDPLKERVRKTYHDMHSQMTVEFVEKQRSKWLQFNHFEATILEALEKLNFIVDESDPDIDLPNIVHAFQTAERIREIHPDNDWFQLTGLIHDLGKVMAFYGEPQWAVTGDTYPVGCLPQKSIVYRETSFANNPDMKNEKYNSEFGIYEPNCGLDQLLMSWGHDEYLYQVLVHNGSKLPEEAHYMIRFHSFYPYHHSGDYRHLANEKDREMFHWIKDFNVFDLYTKSTKIPDIEALKPYYQGLIDKYLPGVLKF